MQKYTEEGQLNILCNFGKTIEELEQEIWQLVQERLADMPKIWSSKIEVKEIQLAGSFIRCINESDSDFDVLFLYSGNVAPRTVLRYMNYPFRGITDIDGIQRRVDFNPINSKKFKTCMDYLDYLEYGVLYL